MILVGVPSTRSLSFFIMSQKASMQTLTKNNNIQMPKQLDYNDGESVTKRASGLIRFRKGQSEEDYNFQKEQFWSTGPLVQNHTFVTEFVEKFIENTISEDYSITDRSKIERETIIHGLEKLYFQREYERCLKDVQLLKDNIDKFNPNLDLNAKKNKNLKRIYNELNYISSMCIKKIHESNEKKLGEI